jgi:hypothetical protein
LFIAADDVTLNGHDPARRIVNREHFKLLYQRNPRDVNENPDSATAVFTAACDKFGENNVRKDNYKQGGNGHEFPVITEDNQILSSLELSDMLKNVPIVAVDYIFINPELYPDAEKWKKENIQTIILLKMEENHE